MKSAVFHTKYTDLIALSLATVSLVHENSKVRLHALRFPPFIVQVKLRFKRIRYSARCPQISRSSISVAHVGTAAVFGDGDSVPIPSPLLFPLLALSPLLESLHLHTAFRQLFNCVHSQRLPQNH